MNSCGVLTADSRSIRSKLRATEVRGVIRHLGDARLGALDSVRGGLGQRVQVGGAHGLGHLDLRVDLFGGVGGGFPGGLAGGLLGGPSVVSSISDGMDFAMQNRI